MLTFLIACGDDADDGVQASAVEFGGAAEVAAALDDAGLGCADFQPLGDGGDVIVETPFEDTSAEQGSCTLVGNVFTTIAYFDTLDDQREYRRLGETQGCEMLAVDEVSYVAGNRWTIEPGGNLEMIEQIVEDIGGRRTTIEC
jgi:hypothetical protein